MSEKKRPRFTREYKNMVTLEIIGWAMDDHLRAELCEGALPSTTP